MDTPVQNKTGTFEREKSSPSRNNQRLNENSTSECRSLRFLSIIYSKNNIIENKFSVYIYLF